MYNETLHNEEWKLTRKEKLFFGQLLNSNGNNYSKEEIEKIVKELESILRKKWAANGYKFDPVYDNRLSEKNETIYRFALETKGFSKEKIDEIVNDCNKENIKVGKIMPWVTLGLFALLLSPLFLWMWYDCCGNITGMFMWWVSIPAIIIGLFILGLRER